MYIYMYTYIYIYMNMCTYLYRHLGSFTAANWVSFDLNVSYSSC